MKNILKINSLTYLFILTSFLCGFIKNTLIIFGIVLFHELGHIMMALLFKYHIKSIEIFPFGGLTKIDSHINDNIFKCLLLASGGVIFQLLIFFLTDSPIIINYNKAIIIFNLLPIIPLDGSKILFEFLNIFLSHKKSMLYLFVISIISIMFYIYFNFYYVLNNYMIVLLLIYKTIMYYKNHDLYQSKFILERILYDFGYNKVDNNIPVKNYQKNCKYYYFLNNKITDEEEYLKNKYNFKT